MPSSLLELRQGLVYTAHSPKNVALGLSSLESLIAGNLPAELSITLSKSYGWSSCGEDYERLKGNIT